MIITDFSIESQFHSYRTNIQWQYEDNKKAEVPSEQCSNDYKSMLFLKVSIAMKEEQCQKEDKNNLKS